MKLVKICGLSTPETLTAAIQSGADFVGFVFYPASPRHLDYETARYLRRYVPDHVKVVALAVDADDETLEQIINAARPAMLQLHGNETPNRVAEIKKRFRLPIMKAFRIFDSADFAPVKNFENTCDWLLFDAKPKDAKLPGGTGQSFDWNILKDRKFGKPWMLSGGLNESNLAAALTILKPDAVDVSSGVETAPGQKDAGKITRFIERVRTI